MVLANFFRSLFVLKPDDLVKTYYLCIGRLAPQYKALETRLGKDILTSVLAKELNISEKDLKAAERLKGDLGDAYFSLRQTASSSNLAITEVYDTFKTIAEVNGESSVAQRDSLFGQLLGRAESLEGKYIVRMAQKGLRIGCSELIMESALARALALTPPQAHPAVLVSPSFTKDLEDIERVVKRAMNECSDTELVLRTLLQYGPAGKPIDYVEEMCSVRPGIPVLPMLAAPCKSVAEAAVRMRGEITCEYKYDGTRAQIHILRDGTVRIFSRNNEETTGMYPDLVALMRENLVLEDCVLDCEVVAVDVRTGKILPFQALQHRKRIDISLSQVDISVCVFLFDLLYLNGKSTLNLPLSERRELLSAHIPALPMRRQLVSYTNINYDGKIMPLLEEAVNAGSEGLMVKELCAHYYPGERSFAWLKLKKDYISMEKSIEDSLDLVPIGAKYGTVGTI